MLRKDYFDRIGTSQGIHELTKNINKQINRFIEMLTLNCVQKSKMSFFIGEAQNFVPHFNIMIQVVEFFSSIKVNAN
jgi:hypothetical protein